MKLDHQKCRGADHRSGEGRRDDELLGGGLTCSDGKSPDQFKSLYPPVRT